MNLLNAASRGLIIASLLFCAGARAEQTTFGAPEEAQAALVAAVKGADEEALKKLFGEKLKEIKNPDAVQAKEEFKVFAARVSECVKLVKSSDDTYTLDIGKREWPFPVPIAKKDGKWIFDTAAGVEELLNRRVGRNELSTIEALRSYVAAQKDYASADRDGDGVLEYAQKIRSTPGQKDGLYWDVKEGEPESPFGDLIGKAESEGYAKADKPQPFRGYYFKLLKKQGEKAAGGKYDYVVNGNMIVGFAMLAYPAEPGNSGVMTFIISNQGRLYQKNLGAETVKTAQEISEFNPDDTWKEVTQ